MNISVKPDGTIVCLYSEDIDLSAIGDQSGGMTMTRASHVDPSADGKSWTADLAPVGGPVLGPFTRRSEALEAEEIWLQVHRLG